MTNDSLEMLVARKGCSGKGVVILANSFSRFRDPNTGKALRVQVCIGGTLLREDGVVLERDGSPSKSQGINPEIIEVAPGDRLEDIPLRNNLPDCFVWKYHSGGYYSG